VYIRRREELAKNKNAYYTGWLGVGTGCVLAGIPFKDADEHVEKLATQIGKLQQDQDDYMDIHIERSKMGKVGLDIENGKCTFMLSMAWKMCNDEQKRQLKANYGSYDKTKADFVRKLYDDIGLTESAWKKIDDDFEELIQDIQKLDEKKFPGASDAIIAFCRASMGRKR
jgi:farnesyl diphosphate synthase